MRLKHLELLGFKSFPVRAQLSFPAGLSAIVGPNGCGKSNIVDAIRWILGEQSPRLLRARTMEDVLYSGDHGHDVNFAEVRLVLENVNGSLAPPELATLPEIEIVRRLYRSGDSEYRLNNKVCRLKDIHYLFMDTGAGTRAYSIIDQGQIGSIVEIGPEERRFLIEEVAGISRYKARRIEAERRIGQTRQNLERIEDVVAEVEKQRRALARQAKTTQRFLNLREEQDRLDRALLAHAWLAGEARVREVEAQASGVSVKAAGLKAALDARRLAAEEMETALLAEAEALEVIRQEVAAAERRHQGLAGETLRADEGIARDQGEIERLERELAGHGNRLTALRERAGQVERERDLLEREEAELTAQLEARGAGLREVEATIGGLREAVEALKVQLVDAAARAARLDGRRRGLRERKERLSRQIEREEGEIKALAEGIASIEGRLRLLREEASSGRDDWERLGREGAAVAETVRACEGRLTGHHERLQGLDARRHRYLAQMETLEALQAGREGVSAANRRLLESGQPHLGLVADYLDVAPGWERAVEAAMGETLQAVVIPGRGTVLGAISLVHEAPGGRARLVVVREGAGDGREMPVSPARPGGSNGDRSLMECVQARPPVHEIAEGLLEGWGVAPDLEQALAAFTEIASDTGQASSCRAVVTPSGDVVTALGEVTTGDGQSAPSGVLVRKAEIALLREEIRVLDAERDEVVRAKAAAEDELALSRAKRDEISTRRDALQRAISDKEREQDRLAADLAHRRDRIAHIEIELSEAREELLEVEIGLEEIEEALEEAAAAQTEAEGRIRGREEALRNQEGVAARRRGAMEQCRLGLVRLQEQRRSNGRELDALKQQAERAGTEREEALKRRAQLAADVERLRAVAEKTRAEVAAQEEALAKMRGRLAKALQGYDEKRQAMAGAQPAIRALQEEIRGCEDSLHRLEIELTTERVRCENLQRACRERHQRDIEDAAGQMWVPEAFDPEPARSRLEELAAEIDRLGPVNLAALEECRQLEERLTFLNTQKADLVTSLRDIEQAILRINRTCRERFRSAMDAVNQHLAEVFPVLFEGGAAELQPTATEDILDCGIDLLIRLPGKRVRHLNLLSGGEKALAAIGLILAIYLTKPSPFCILDEVDAPLDEANTSRFNRLLQRIAEQSQVILITHNQRVMETADTLYGVTMEEKGISKLVSVDLVSR